MALHPSPKPCKKERKNAEILQCCSFWELQNAQVQEKCLGLANLGAADQSIEATAQVGWGAI